MSRIIVEPRDIDSLSKLNEWIAECGMPQHVTRCSDAPVRIRWEKWGFGFKFEPGNRKQANEGYRALISQMARALYDKFMDDTVSQVIWRVRPELDEARLMKLVNADGTDCHLNEGDDEIPAGAYHVDTGYYRGRFFCHIGFVMEDTKAGT